MATFWRLLKGAVAVCCLLAAAVQAMKPFAESSLWPLLWSGLLLAPLFWLRRSWLRWAWVLPVLAFVVLVIDATFFRHRLAVEWRTWAPIFDIEHLAERLESPSGQTTAYLVHAGFADSWFEVYVSAGKLFPLHAHLESESENVGMKDLVMEWKGSLFTAGVGRFSFAYSEAEQRAWSYEEWCRGPVSLTDPPRTLEAFSEMLRQMREAEGGRDRGAP